MGIGIHIKIHKECIMYQFVRNYVPDMTWGYALIFTLYSLLDNEMVNVWMILLSAILFSALLEILQISAFVKGTFDIFDIVAECLAETFAILIIKKYVHGGREK
jgi:hypothetical protein